MSDYYLSDGETRIGPFSVETLSKMSLSPETAVMAENGDTWAAAAAQDDLAAMLQPQIEARMATAQSDEMTAAADDAMTAAGAMHWGPAKADQCTKPGYRQYSAILWDIPWGQDWGQACQSHPNTINGHYFARPHRCKKSATHMWGEWDVPDSGCAAATTGINALVFLLPDFPIQLGHVGWGFQNGDGTWTYGATENNGMPVVPGMDNGMFIDTGSKAEMMTTFRDGRRNNGKGCWKYYSYKMLRSPAPNPARGQTSAQMAKSSGYIVVGNNCMDHTVRVLNDFAQVPIVPLPAAGGPVTWIPRVWFTMINGKEKMMHENF